MSKEPREFWIDTMMLDKPYCRYAYTEHEEALEKASCNLIHVREVLPDDQLNTLTAKVKRYEEVFNKEFFLNIITEWKFSWMNQRQNDQKDYENYHRRAFGVDANMKHDLASRLARAALNQGED